MKAVGLGTLSEFGMSLAIGVLSKSPHKGWKLNGPPHSKEPVGSTHYFVAFELFF